MDALVIVDMQQDIRGGEPKHELDAVIDRIDRAARLVRERSGAVIFVQHDGNDDLGFVPGTAGWEIVDGLERRPEDRFVRKSLNDAFHESDLGDQLTALAPERLLIAGWATDSCVDGTLRSAVTRGFRVVAIADAHTVADRPGIDAPTVIAYHNWLWTTLLTPSPVRVVPVREL